MPLKLEKVRCYGLAWAFLWFSYRLSGYQGLRFGLLVIKIQTAACAAGIQTSKLHCLKPERASTVKLYMAFCFRV